MKQYSEFMALVRQKLGSIILLGILLSALSFLFLVSNERNFKVSTDYLVVQNSSNSTDTYALAKSAEYIGRILAEGMRSELFINEVIKTGKVNPEFLPFDKKEKLKNWEKMVRVEQNANLGIISVSVFNDSQRQAAGIAEAVSEVLTTKNNLFRGEGQHIEVRILSGPVVEKNPSLADIIAAAVAGFVFGSFVSVVFIYYKTPGKTKTYGSSAAFGQMGMGQKERMDRSGIFAQDDNYLESLRNLDK